MRDNESIQSNESLSVSNYDENRKGITMDELLPTLNSQLQTDRQTDRQT